MHVKCVLVCCAYTQPKVPRSTSKPTLPVELHYCLPTAHIYRTDTEMCGICHLFAHEISGAASVLPTPPKQRRKTRSKRGRKKKGHDNRKVDCDKVEKNDDCAMPTNHLPVVREDQWHCRPNSALSKTSQNRVACV